MVSAGTVLQRRRIMSVKIEEEVHRNDFVPFSGHDEEDLDQCISCGDVLVKDQLIDHTCRRCFFSDADVAGFGRMFPDDSVTSDV
jgi:hypothetical protein